MRTNSEFIRDKPTPANNASNLFGFLHKVLPLLVIVGGFSVAGTSFAVEHPDIATDQPIGLWGGAPVYWPWQYIVWVARIYSFEAVRDDAYAIFSSSSNLILLSCGIAIVLYFVLSYLRGLKRNEDLLYGTARWATLRDLKRAGLYADSGIVLGQRREAKIRVDGSSGTLKYRLLRPAPILAHSGATHTLMVAPSRSGKGVSTVIPTLLSWRGSTIVFDPKGENYAITAGFRRKFSHVLRFSPVSPETSIFFNPLQEIRPGRMAFRDASNIADILVSPAGGEGAKEGTPEAHFTERAKSLLTGAILHVLTSPYRTDKSLGGVLEFLSSIPVDSEDGESDSGAGLLKEMLETSHTDEGIEAHIKHIASQNLSTPDRERGSIFSTITKALWLFEDPLVRACTSKHELSIQDFMDAEFPISLYITVPYSDIDKLSPVIRLIVSFFVRRFSEGEAQYGTQQLAHKTLFLLDEFPVLGSFPFLEKTMGILAGYGVIFLIIVQSLTQIQKLYGEKNPFMEHCKVWITFAPGDLNSAKTFSEVIGKQTVFKEQISTSGSKFEIGMKNMNISGNEVERNLINADEIMKLSPDSMLLFSHGMPPYLGKKVIYYEDARFKSITSLPAPDSREELLAELPRGGTLTETWEAVEGAVNPALLKKVVSKAPDPGFVRMQGDSIPPELLLRSAMPGDLPDDEAPPLPPPPVYDRERVLSMGGEPILDAFGPLNPLAKQRPLTPEEKANGAGF